ncbi:hypothetical protein, partial [Bifidobacterium aquikefiri]|uniref:hypothetical protein n=1 Tax=Bifidobacterium aquikefiri TaxID=1653207 RepID=UPI0039E8806D
SRRIAHHPPRTLAALRALGMTKMLAFIRPTLTIMLSFIRPTLTVVHTALTSPYDRLVPLARNDGIGELSISAYQSVTCIPISHLPAISSDQCRT